MFRFSLPVVGIGDISRLLSGEVAYQSRKNRREEKETRVKVSLRYGWQIAALSGLGLLVLAANLPSPKWWLILPGWILVGLYSVHLFTSTDDTPYKSGFVFAGMALFLLSGVTTAGLRAAFRLIFEPSFAHLYSLLVNKEFLVLVIVYLGTVCFFYGVKVKELTDVRVESVTMTPIEAETIVQQYGAALARGTPTERGIARYESYLPCSKERIKQATKVFLAFKIEYHSLEKEFTETLLGAVSHLNAFVPEETANRINSSKHTLEDEEYWQFSRAMFGMDIREEMDNFILDVQALDRDDPLFHQRVFTLAGIPYSPKIEKGYTDILLNE